MPGLQTVYQLQLADLERADVARRLREAEEGLGETQALRQAREKVRGEETTLARLRAHGKSLELELQSLTDKMTGGEKRLYSGDVRNPKELQDLQADLAQLRARRDALEDSFLSNLTESDENAERLERAQRAYEATQGAWEKDQERLGATVAGLRTALQRLNGRIAGLRAALPSALLEAYDDTCAKKGGRGVAAIRGGLCEGCRVAVPTRLVQHVRRAADIVRCDNCGRILCVPD